MDGYILAQSWSNPNIQDRLYYCMTETDKDELARDKKLSFGDKAYIITTKKIYIMGNDNIWYEM